MKEQIVKKLKDLRESPHGGLNFILWLRKAGTKAILPGDGFVLMGLASLISQTDLSDGDFDYIAEHMVMESPRLMYLLDIKS